MKALLDLNVMLDFLEKRSPFYEGAVSIVDAVLYGWAQGALAAHAVTTLSYFLAKGTDRDRQWETLQWLLDTFEIVPCDKQVLADALALGIKDYEDAVTCVAAARAGCSHVVTRNVQDFLRSPVPALTPAEFLHAVETR